MKTSMQPIPELHGSESLTSAYNELLDQSAMIGAVIVRNAFDSRLVRPHMQTVMLRDMHDDTNLQSAESDLTVWWRRNGPADTYVNARHAQLGYKHTGESVLDLDTDNFRALSHVACVSGKVELVTRPALKGENNHGILDYYRVAANQTDRLATTQYLNRDDSNEAYDKLFSHHTEMKPGDIALVSGTPYPTVNRLRSNNSAIYVLHSYVAEHIVKY